MWILSLVRINILWLYNMLFKMYKICIWLNELKYTWTQKHYFKLNHFSSWSNMCRYVQHLYLADSPLILKQIGHFKLAKNFMTSLSTDCSQDESFLANFSCIFCIFPPINPLCKFSALPGRGKTMEGLSVFCSCCSNLKLRFTIEQNCS